MYLRLGRGDTVGEDQYCEANIPGENLPTDFYLRLGSYKTNTIDWIIRGQEFTGKYILFTTHSNKYDFDFNL